MKKFFRYLLVLVIIVVVGVAMGAAFIVCNYSWGL